MSVTINIPPYGIELVLRSDAEGEKVGTIRSELKSDCPHCSKPYCFFDCDESQHEDSQESETEARERLEKNRAYDGIESLILTLACQDFDVESPAFTCAIEEAIDAVENNI